NWSPPMSSPTRRSPGLLASAGEVRKSRSGAGAATASGSTAAAAGAGATTGAGDGAASSSTTSSQSTLRGPSGEVIASCPSLSAPSVPRTVLPSRSSTVNSTLGGGGAAAVAAGAS